MLCHLVSAPYFTLCNLDNGPAIAVLHGNPNYFACNFKKLSIGKEKYAGSGTIFTHLYGRRYKKQALHAGNVTEARKQINI